MLPHWHMAWQAEVIFVGIRKRHPFPWAEAAQSQACVLVTGMRTRFCLHSLDTGSKANNLQKEYGSLVSGFHCRYWESSHQLICYVWRQSIYLLPICLWLSAVSLWCILSIFFFSFTGLRLTRLPESMGWCFIPAWENSQSSSLPTCLCPKLSLLTFWDSYQKHVRSSSPTFSFILSCVHSIILLPLLHPGQVLRSIVQFSPQLHMICSVD